MATKSPWCIIGSASSSISRPPFKPSSNARRYHSVVSRLESELGRLCMLPNNQHARSDPRLQVNYCLLKTPMVTKLMMRMKMAQICRRSSRGAGWAMGANERTLSAFTRPEPWPYPGFLNFSTRSLVCATFLPPGAWWARAQQRRSQGGGT